MMRARWLKPEFFKDRKMAALGPVPALVYQALWCMADDGGTAPCDPEVIKGEMFVWWSAAPVPEITGALRALYEAGRIVFHRTEDEWFCTIVRWEDHQAIHKASAFRYSLSRKDFRDSLPWWLEDSGTGAAPVPHSTGTPHIPDTQTPRLQDTNKQHAAAPRSKQRRPRKAAKQSPAPAATLDEAIAELDEQDRATNGKHPEAKATWLTPLSGPWEAKFGEHTFHFPKWGKQLQPFQALLKARPPDEVAQRFTRYLEQFSAKDAHFASPAKFCETYDTYAEELGDPLWRNGWMTPEADRLTGPGW